MTALHRSTRRYFSWKGLLMHFSITGMAWQCESRKCVERCYFMKKQLKELLDDSSTQSWKKRPEFFQYQKSIQCISRPGDVSKGGREYFGQPPVTCFKTFIVPYNKLIECCWRHWKILSDIIAGDPTLACTYLD